MLVDFISYVPAIIGIFLITFFVAIRHPYRVYRLFCAVTALMGLWVFFQFLTDISVGTVLSLPAIQIGTIIPNFMGLFFIFFCAEYTKIHLPKWLVIALIIPPILLTPFSFTGLIVSSVEQVGQSFTVTVGSLYTLQTLFIVGYFIVGLGMLLKHYFKTRGRERTQIIFLFLAFLSPVIINFITNFVFVKSAVAQLIGPTSFLIMVGIMAYAMIKHRLFDISLIVARSVAYVFAFSAAAVLYVAAVLSITSVTSSSQLTLEEQLIYLVPAAVIGLTFPALKRFFDKITNHIFYRDAYDPQELFADVNNVMVSSIDASQLLRKTSGLMVHHMKSEFCAFSIFPSENLSRQLIGSKPLQFSEEDLVILDEAAKKHAKHLVVFDELQDTTTALYKVMHKHSIHVLGCLKSSQKGSEGVVGYILLGHKKSGNMYSQRDLSVIHILINELVIAIQNALRFEEINNFNATLQEEVNHATERLRHANQRLKTLDQLKDDFISMASHQFRTPAGSIRQALQMLNSPGLTAADRKEMLLLAEANSEELVTLVGTMLNISRLQAGRFTIDKTPTDLVSLAQKVITATDILAQRKHMKVVFENTDKSMLADIDFAKIKEAMTNYVENAIKYTPEKNTITIRLRKDANRAYFEVLDEGMGVPEDERKHLFGRFYRAQNARKHQPDGNGIGLYVVKSIAEGHKGEAYYEPREKGSLFGFWIPLPAVK